MAVSLISLFLIKTGKNQTLYAWFILLPHSGQTWSPQFCFVSIVIFCPHFGQTHFLVGRELGLASPPAGPRPFRKWKLNISTSFYWDLF